MVGARATGGASGAAATAATLPLSPQRMGRIRTLLLEWYGEHAQLFPWRDPPNPYAALVAAVCSQQTQMSRVLPLWLRWTAAFPTIETLAAADSETVLRVWDRGGYPRRALHLREAALICVARHGGAVPQDEAALLALPGVGPFTAAIVRSFGFGADSAAVDTNIVRVLGRIVHGDLQPARETRPAVIAATAEQMLRPGTAARWNPALMDYGAAVCTPRPHCEVCVVAHLCRARPRFAAGERATPVRAQAAFAGSDRQLRGHILHALRQAAGPLPTRRLLAELVAAHGVSAEGAAEGAPEGEGSGAGGGGGRARFERLLADLRRDRLVWSHGRQTGLGGAPRD